VAETTVNRPQHGWWPRLGANPAASGRAALFEGGAELCAGTRSVRHRSGRWFL